MPNRPADVRPAARGLFLAVTLALGLAIVALLVLLADARGIAHRAAGIPPASLFLPIALGMLSYAAMARSYQGIALAAAVDLPYLVWLRLTFVSNTVNYLVTSAGLSGFAVRMLLLAQHGVPSGRAVVVSFVQMLLTNFTILILVLVGFASLLVHGELGATGLGATAGAVAIFAIGIAYTAVLAFRRRLRRRSLTSVTLRSHRALRRFLPRWAPARRRLFSFQHHLDEGLDFVLARKHRMLGPAAWILLDWFMTMGILWWAFRVLHHPLAPGLVLIGMGVGLVLSFVSIVPGGLGIVEGSMTAVFVGLGVPFDTAVMAVLIFRSAYYVIPVLVSLLFFHGLVRQLAGTPARV